MTLFGEVNATVDMSVFGGAGGGIALANSAATQTSGTVIFSNTNGLSWTLTGGTLQGAYSQSTHDHGTLGYLTTAALSNHTHGSAPSITGSIGVTSNSSAWSISIPNFLTTAALSQDSSKYAGINGAITGGSITVNTSGVSVNLPAYLTTAAQSGHTHGSGPTINGAISVTSSSNAWSLSIGPYLTTAMLSNAGSNFAGLGETVGTTAGTDLKLTVDSNGVNISHPKWITTGMASDAGSAWMSTSERGNYFYSSANTFANQTHTHGSAPSITGSIGVTSNSGAWSISIPAFLTTAMLSNAGSNFAGLGETVTTTGGTDLKLTVDSNGVQIAHPAWLTAATAGGDGYNVILGSGNTAGTMNTYLSATFVLAGGNGITLSQSSNTMSVLAGNYLTTAMASNRGSDFVAASAAFAGTNASGTIASNGISVSVAAPGGGMTGSVFNLLEGQVQGTTGITSLGKSSCLVQPFFLPQAMSISYVRLPVSVSLNASGSTTTAARSWTLQQTDTYWVNFFSQGAGANSRSLQYVAGSSAVLTLQHRYEIGAASNNQSHSMSVTHPYEGNQSSYALSNGINSASFTFHTTNHSSIFGYRWLDVPFASSLSAGAWWIQIQRSSATASTTAGGNWANMTNLVSNMQMVGASQVNVSIQPLGFASNANTNVHWQYGAGMWTTNSNGRTTDSMALSHISGVANRPVFPIVFVRQS